MACEAGGCGSCVFTRWPGAKEADINQCTMARDSYVEETYQRFLLCGGVCGKYQLNPAALED